VHFCEKLKLLVADLFRQASLDPRLLDERVKDCKRVEEKIRERGTSVDSWPELHAMGDLAGVRAVFRYRDEVERAAEVLRPEFQIHADQAYGYRDHLDPRQFGYSTWQLTVSLDPKRASATELREHCEKRGEIQLRTLLQHAWAEHSHSFHYRTPGIRPVEIERRLARLAALVEMADHELLGLRGDIQRLRADYYRLVRRGAYGKIDLNLDSLEIYLELNPLTEVLQSIRSLEYDDSGGVPPPGNIAMFVKYAIESGFSTIKDVRQLARSVAKRGDDLIRIRDETIARGITEGPAAEPLEILIFLLILDHDRAAQLLQGSSGDFGPRVTDAILAARRTKSNHPS